MPTGQDKQDIRVVPVTISYEDAVIMAKILNKTGYPFDGETNGKLTTYRLYVPIKQMPPDPPHHNAPMPNRDEPLTW